MEQLSPWSESGQLKRQTIRTLVLPDQTPDGQEITAIGEAAFKIPDAEVEITKFGVNSPNGMTSVVLPEKATVIVKKLSLRMRWLELILQVSHRLRIRILWQ